MISSNDLRNGITIVLDGQLWTVLEFLHVKPGKGSAFVRTRIKNVKSGATVESTELAVVVTRPPQSNPSTPAPASPVGLCGGLFGGLGLVAAGLFFRARFERRSTRG